MSEQPDDPNARCPECGWLLEMGHATYCDTYADQAQDAQGDRVDET